MAQISQSGEDPVNPFPTTGAIERQPFYAADGNTGPEDPMKQMIAEFGRS